MLTLFLLIVIIFLFSGSEIVLASNHFQSVDFEAAHSIPCDAVLRLINDVSIAYLQHYLLFAVRIFSILLRLAMNLLFIVSFFPDF
jgi:hypothetical protein